MSLYGLCRDILSGEAEPESLGPHWERSMSFHFYNIAKPIMDSGLPGWRELLDQDYPPRIAELIKLECIRIYRIRKHAEEVAKFKASQQKAEQMKSTTGWADWV